MPESNTLLQNARPMKNIRDPKYNNHVLFLSFGKCICLIEALTAFFGGGGHYCKMWCISEKVALVIKAPLKLFQGGI